MSNLKLCLYLNDDSILHFTGIEKKDIKTAKDIYEFVNEIFSIKEYNFKGVKHKAYPLTLCWVAKDNINITSYVSRVVAEFTDKIYKFELILEEVEMKSKGLEALKKLMNNYYEMCEDTENNDDNYQKCNLTSERAIIEKELNRLEKYDEIVRNNIKVYKKYLYTDNGDIYVCCFEFKGYKYTINEELYLFLKGAFELEEL